MNLVQDHLNRVGRLDLGVGRGVAFRLLGFVLPLRCVTASLGDRIRLL